jgi:hypothetical protein
MGTKAVTITSVTEVIEVIGYQLWRGVLWPYCLRMYRSFNPENWIRRHIRVAYQAGESTLEISRIPVCQNDGISVGRYSTYPEEPGRLHPGSFSCPCALHHPGDEGCVPRYSGTLVARSMSQKPGSLAMSNKRSIAGRSRSVPVTNPETSSACPETSSRLRSPELLLRLGS